MKKMNKYFSLLLLLVGCVQINGKEHSVVTEDYSKMSISELDAAFILAVQERCPEKMK